MQGAVGGAHRKRDGREGRACVMSHALHSENQCLGMLPMQVRFRGGALAAAMLVLQLERNSFVVASALSRDGGKGRDRVHGNSPPP